MIPENDVITLSHWNPEGWQIFTIDGKRAKYGFGSQIVVDLTMGLYIIRVGKHSQKFMVY